MSNVKWIKFPNLDDSRGGLVALESGIGMTVPFDTKRIYYIYGVRPGVSRGFHAHYNLSQVVICIAGRCRMILDDGNVREEVWMECPTKGLLIENMIWREMHDFSSDCVLLVLASEHYDENDYIRDYSDFIGAM